MNTKHETFYDYMLPSGNNSIENVRNLNLKFLKSKSLPTHVRILILNLKKT